MNAASQTFFPDMIPFLAEQEYEPINEDPKCHHCSIQNMKYEPKELTEPPGGRETEQENKLAQELLCRLFHVSEEDPRNFLILYYVMCTRTSFVELSHDKRFYGMSEDVIRKRYHRMVRRMRTK